MPAVCWVAAPLRVAVPTFAEALSVIAQPLVAVHWFCGFSVSFFTVTGTRQIAELTMFWIDAPSASHAPWK